MMERLSEQLRWWATECDRTNYGCQARKSLVEAADRLAYYEDMEEQGRLFIPPCAVGERWRDTRGEVFTVDGFHCDKWAGWSILYHYENGEDCACNPIYFKAHFTREETEQAYKQVQDAIDRHNRESMSKIAAFIEPKEDADHD